MKRWLGAFLAGFLITALVGTILPVSAQSSPPVVESVVPAEAFAGTDLSLSVSGKNFASEPTLWFEPMTGITVLSVTRVSGSELRATLAIAADAPAGTRDVVVSNPDQQQGILKAGLTIRPAKSLGALTLAPAQAQNPVGTQHAVTATLADTAGKPVVGVKVSFQVTGANPGSGSAFTNQAGQASHSYQGSKTGDDTITAAVGQLAATASKQWQTPAPVPALIWLAPGKAENPVGSQHRVVATVFDEQGRPVAGVRVSFQVTGANSASGLATTDASGQAAFSYQGSKAGEDTITAMTGKLAATASKQWAAAAPTPATVRLTPEKAENPAGSSHKVVATVLDAQERPVSGVRVTFQVTGANAADGSGTTGAGGQTSFTYTGHKTGEDRITATAGNLTASASKHWTAAAPGPAKVLLAPEKAESPVGSSHKVVATVLDAQEKPVSGVRVTFQVTGANAAGGSGTTGAGGQTSFAYTGQKTGEDRITAAAGNLTASASKRWVPLAAPPVPKAIWAIQGRAENVVGTHHTVIAYVFGADGKPLAGAQVTFQVAGANPTSGVVTTDASGQAVFFYQGNQPGADTITVTVGNLQVKLAKRWVAAPSPPPQVGQVSPTTGQPGQDVRLTISGRDFSPGTRVSLSPDAGSLHLGQTRVLSSSELELEIRLLPGAQPGPRGVVVTNPDGQSGERGQAFMVVQPPSDPPALTGLSALEGEQGQTLEVSLFGSGFSRGCEVLFRFPTGDDLAGLSPQPDPPGRAGITVDHTRWVNENELRVGLTIAGDAPPGPLDVMVLSPAGECGAIPQGFSVVEAARRPTVAGSVAAAQPGDRAGLGEPRPTFRWRIRIPLLTRIGLFFRRQPIAYSLACWELEPGQDPAAAPSSFPCFEVTGLRKTSLPYPADAAGLAAGKEYAWQVTAFAGSQLVSRSEVQTFFLLFSPAYRATIEQELGTLAEIGATSSGDRAAKAGETGRALQGALDVIDSARGALDAIGDCVRQAGAAAVAVAGMGGETGIDDDPTWIRVEGASIQLRIGEHQTTVRIDDDPAWAPIGERRAGLRVAGSRVEVRIGDRVGTVSIDDDPTWVPLSSVWTPVSDQALHDRLSLLHDISDRAAGGGLETWLFLMGNWESIWEELAGLAPGDWDAIRNLGLSFNDTTFLVITLRDLARAADFAGRTDQESYRKQGWRDRWDAIGHYFEVTLGKGEAWRRLRSAIGTRRLEDLLARVDLERYLR